MRFTDLQRELMARLLAGFKLKSTRGGMMCSKPGERIYWPSHQTVRSLQKQGLLKKTPLFFDEELRLTPEGQSEGVSH